MPPGHVWLMIGSCNFSSGVGTTVAFGEAAVLEGTERVVLSFIDWIGDNLDVAAEVGRVGVGLRKLAVEPDGVVAR